ncbi:hypothetical protein QVD17_25046 [Tagetes erecta]|uniref:Uncharacterized protein n=1 Tax=Tagetes erecta TaxID=13708 RepID=A0AAD8KM78_TARER|nr:hypothetical protein QVD17_25046 [Tagetes erecta]
MAVAELFIGAFITVLFEKLAYSDLIKLARSTGIYSELEKWKNILTQIQDVLLDAGHKHIRERSVQSWLNKLQHLAYEIDDALDDLATEAARRRLSQKCSPNNNTSKVLKFVPNKFHDLKYGRKMSAKLDEITTKLHDLIEEKNLLGLSVNVESANRVSRRFEETSLVVESQVIGREDDKVALLRTLLENVSLSDQTQNFKVVSIVGLGGIGKTTLAQLLYNDKRVKDHFEVMAWVCVSDEFDVFSISKSIFQAIGGGNQDFADLNLLQVALSKELSNKKFLLVLDDVWNEKYNEWERLQRPFYVGSHGSKILVTTRKTIVASTMDSVQTYTLELLSYEEALSLFSHHASSKQNFDVKRILELHGKDIVKKCGRLPLALRTLGRVFRKKSTYEEWKKLLKSEIWNLDIEGEIPTTLRLSYHDLPPHLKQMFTYCCLFPKDYIFDQDELVMMWMAEGFLNEPNRDDSMEDLGGEYFKELVSRSFFQHSTEFKFKYIMHDLVNDLAINVGGEFFFMLDDRMNVNNMHEALEKAHHLSFIHEKDTSDKKFKALQTTRRLRTCLVGGVFSALDTFYSNKVVIELQHQLQFLRVFSLAGNNIREVPQSIGCLKHLRYLNFSVTKITCLPEQVGNLHNLQSLLLSNCVYLSSLPKSTIKLINLRHLDIAWTRSLNKMPLGLGGLTRLQTLCKFIIGGASECKISDLKGLVHLRGQLSIKGLHEVKDAQHAKEANLHHKKGIYDLRLGWSDIFDDSRNKTNEYEVLEGLRPFEKLSRLEIKYYNGTKFSSWVGDPTFYCLTELILYGCRSCTCLPTLGQLPSLQTLSVSRMYELKRLGSEFLQPSDTCHGVAFPSLIILRFSDMMGWEEWLTSNGDQAGAFPCLREISIQSCMHLKSFPYEHLQSLTSLKDVMITCCPSMGYFFPYGMWPPNLSSLTIGGLKKPISEWGMQNFPTSLVKMRLYGENSGVVLFSKEDKDMTSSSLLLPSSLTSLHIREFMELESLSKGLQHLTCLRELQITRCPKLRDLPETLLHSLSRLDVYGYCHPELKKMCGRKGKYWPIIS